MLEALMLFYRDIIFAFLDSLITSETDEASEQIKNVLRTSGMFFRIKNRHEFLTFYGRIGYLVS